MTNTDNPYQPPHADVRDQAVPSIYRGRKVVAGVMFVLAILILFVMFAGGMLRLVRHGAIPPYPFLLAVLFSILLLVGTGLLGFTRRRGQALSLLAGLGLALSAAGFWQFALWGVHWLVAAGAVSGLAGWWFGRKTARPRTS